jgi:predicted nuclease of predicted toxin-antitoxin system
LVTLDKDFGERAVVFGEPHRGIIRLVGISARRQGETCLRTLTKYEG